MTENRRCESAAGYMTDVAILICCHMRGIGLGTLAGCVDTIVAGITPLTHNLGSVVVNKRASKIYRVMTRRTISARVAMNCSIRRPSGPSSYMIRYSVMARGAIFGDTCVSKNRWCE